MQEPFSSHADLLLIVPGSRLRRELKSKIKLGILKAKSKTLFRGCASAGSIVISQSYLRITHLPSEEY